MDLFGKRFCAPWGVRLCHIFTYIFLQLLFKSIRLKCPGGRSCFFGHWLSIAAFELNTTTPGVTQRPENRQRIRRPIINCLSNITNIVFIVQKQVSNDKGHEIIALTQCTNPADQNWWGNFWPSKQFYFEKAWRCFCSFKWPYFRFKILRPTTSIFFISSMMNWHSKKSSKMPYHFSVLLVRKH